MIEIVAAEIVDHRPGRARGHERIDVDALVHEDGRSADGLIGVVAPDHALAGLGIVRLADTGEQQHADVVEREGRDQHEVGGLLILGTRGVDIGDAGRLLAGAVEIDPQYLTIGSQLVIWIS